MITNEDRKELNRLLALIIAHHNSGNDRLAMDNVKALFEALEEFGAIIHYEENNKPS